MSKCFQVVQQISLGIDQMCSNIRIMVESMVAIVLRVDDFINVLSTSDKDIIGL